MSSDKVSILVAHEALVVFEDRDDARLLRWLRPGFRHCFCLLGEDRRWTLCDPLKSRLAVAAIDGLTAAALATHFLAHGRHVLHGSVNSRPGEAAGLGLLTCVEVVKRMIGLRTRRVVTPYQLYRRLLIPQPGRAAFVELTAGHMQRSLDDRNI